VLKDPREYMTQNSLVNTSNAFEKNVHSEIIPCIINTKSIKVADHILDFLSVFNCKEFSTSSFNFIIFISIINIVIQK
jgi:hypothetical protein